MTKYILDTDICSYILKRHPMSVVAKYSMATPEDMYMSVATYAELLFGAEKIQSKKN